MDTGPIGQFKTLTANDDGGPAAIDGAVCERCGRVDSLVGCGGLTLCEDCYYLYGSCCTEIDPALDS